MARDSPSVEPSEELREVVIRLIDALREGDEEAISKPHFSPTGFERSGTNPAEWWRDGEDASRVWVQQVRETGGFPEVGQRGHADILGSHPPERLQDCRRAGGFPDPVGREGQSRLWDRREVAAWAKRWRKEKAVALSPYSGLPLLDGYARSGFFEISPKRFSLDVR
jgi:hypothetical protein